MSIRDELELAVTRKKLRMVEERAEALKQRPVKDPHLRELTLRSLVSLVNQLREEIVRYTSRTGARPKG
jgi:hypothetical protein